MPERGSLPLARRRRIPIGFGPGPQQAGSGRPFEIGAPRRRIAIEQRARDKSSADDFAVDPGRVSSRVALLLRATERKPVGR